MPTLSHLAMGLTLGWDELAEGGVRVRVVPGDHNTMITEPLVSHLAKSLSDELDAAQALPRNDNQCNEIFDPPIDFTVPAVSEIMDMNLRLNFGLFLFWLNSRYPLFGNLRR